MSPEIGDRKAESFENLTVSDMAKILRFVRSRSMNTSVIPFRLRVEDGYGTVEVLDEHYFVIQNFLSGLFGREGLDQQIAIAHAVTDGTYSEVREGTERRMAVYERYHNYHHIVVTPSTVTVEQEDWGSPVSLSTGEWLEFLGEIGRRLDEVDD